MNVVCKFKIKVLSGMVSKQNFRTLSGLQIAAFSLYPQMAFLLCINGEIPWGLFLFV